MDASRSTRLGFSRQSSVEVMMIVAVALAAGCVALVLTAQQPARASFPGQNGTIAFVGLDAESSNYQIFTVSPSGGAPRQLTFGEGDKESPTWSPDGRKIAFVTNRGEPHGRDIYTMKADGSEQAVLTRSPKDDRDPSWSPDGRRLIFSRQVTEARPETGELANRELVSVRRDGTHPVRLTHTPEESELDPAWSPDGTEIAFSTFTHVDYPGYGSIYVMKADGSEPPAVLLPYLGYVGGLGWSPDGQWLAFSSGGPHSSCITKMRADGSEQPTNLVCGDPYGCYLPDYYPSWPDWSPDGTKMVFHDSCNGLVTMDNDGENLRTIFGGWADQPSWRPVVR
jgi:Tol biopolymer transport system component